MIEHTKQLVQFEMKRISDLVGAVNAAKNEPGSVKDEALSAALQAPIRVEVRECWDAPGNEFQIIMSEGVFAHIRVFGTCESLWYKKGVLVQWKVPAESWVNYTVTDKALKAALLSFAGMLVYQSPDWVHRFQLIETRPWSRVCE